MAEVTESEREGNDAYFSAIEVHDRNERALLKCAKDLRLVLPRYLQSHSTR